MKMPNIVPNTRSSSKSQTYYSVTKLENQIFIISPIVGNPYYMQKSEYHCNIWSISVVSGLQACEVNKRTRYRKKL